MPNHKLEHRWGERHDVKFAVHVAAGDALPAASAYVKNLSLSGALMEPDCHWRLNTLIEIGIPLPAPSSGMTLIKAIVSRRLKDGVAIEWYEFAPKAIKELLRSQRTI